MDTTADAYMYAGVRMVWTLFTDIQAPVKAAFIQIAGAALIAWLLGERWQRWRQRREFQYRMMITFSEQTDRAFTILSTLLVWGPIKMPVERWNALFSEASVLSRSIAGSFPLARFTFTDPEVASGILGTKRVMSACLRIAPKQPRADPEVHERLQVYMVMLRDLTLLRMALEMKTARGAKFKEQRASMEIVIANPAPEVVAAMGAKGEEV